ncbi:hypothetical protein CICLE_v10013377mg [Citrus x clementina]|uniref:Uncharacterized protein n=1 Tax=Citrus clementina TaxID=85681 RepID=V4SYY4_CITCL|nr:hypothetical protein CICLE_v10013377mg [Citrus x clementina]
MKTWNANNKICRYTILSALSNNRYDIYYTYKNAYEIWNLLNNKSVTNQIHDYHRSVDNLKNEESWNDYIKTAKRKKKPMSLEDVVVHIKIEEQNRLRDMARNLHSNANIIETKP